MKISEYNYYDDNEEVFVACPSFINKKEEVTDLSRIDALVSLCESDVSLSNIHIMKTILLSIIDKYDSDTYYNNLCKIEISILNGEINRKELLKVYEKIKYFAMRIKNNDQYKGEEIFEIDDIQIRFSHEDDNNEEDY